MADARRAVVLIGCGAIMELGHAPALAALADRCQVRAVVDPVAERRDLLGERFGVAAGARYSLVRQALDEVDRDVLAVVAVPTPVLATTVRAVVAAGIPVLAEKPLATSADAVRELASGDIHVVHNYLHRNEIREALQLMGRGVIGSPRFIRLERPDPSHFRGRGAEADWRRTDAVGCLLDNAYHWVYVAEALAGSPVHLVSAQLAAPAPSGPEDLAVLTMRHSNGVLTAVQTAWCVADGMSVLEVHGTAGSLRMLQNGSCAVSAPGYVAAGPSTRRQSSYTALYREIFAALDAGQDFGASVDQCAHVLSVLEAAYRSTAEERTTPVES